jgi:hypothetical protein
VDRAFKYGPTSINQSINQSMLTLAPAALSLKALPANALSSVSANQKKPAILLLQVFLMAAV